MSKMIEKGSKEDKDLKLKMKLAREAREAKKKAKETLEPPKEETKKVVVTRISIKGVEYLKAKETNILYDPKTREEIGVWNKDTETIEDLPDEYYEDEEEEEEEEPPPKPTKVTVSKFNIKGVEYFKAPDTNMLYDPKTREEIGIWNPKTKTIEEIPDDYDSEEEGISFLDKLRKQLKDEPKPKPTPKEELEPKSGKVTVTRISIKGVEYLKDGDNVLYDPKTNEEKGIWNLDTKTIEELPDSFYEDEEEEEEKPKPTKVKVSRFTVKGKEYLKNIETNVLYNEKTREEIGIWNPKTKTIEEIPDDYDSEEERKEKKREEGIARIEAERARRREELQKKKAKEKAEKAKEKAEKVKQVKFRQQTLDLPFDMKKEILGFLPSFTKKDKDILEEIQYGFLSYNIQLLFILQQSGEDIKFSKQLQKNIDKVEKRLLDLFEKTRKIFEKNGIDADREDLDYSLDDFDYFDFRRVGLYYSDGALERFDKKELNKYLDKLDEIIDKREREITEIGDKQLSFKPI